MSPVAPGTVATGSTCPVPTPLAAACRTVGLVPGKPAPLRADPAETAAADARQAVAEWPTLLVALAIYGGWLALALFHQSIPLVLLLPLAAYVVAWHGSLQHETIHGHPFRSAALNRLIASPPLALLTPYPLYRDLHVEHHRTDRLTDPAADPESYYWAPQDWHRLPAWLQSIHRWHMTLPGRLLLGPALLAWKVLTTAARDVRAGRPGARRMWAAHGLWVAALLGLLWLVCGIDPLSYALLFAYPGLGLTLLRSFAEHRPAPDNKRATAIVETNPLLALLFLNNNLHSVHHADPRLPWYRIPAAYRQHQATILAENGGYHVSGYGVLARRHWLIPRDQPVWPAATRPSV